MRILLRFRGPWRHSGRPARLVRFWGPWGVRESLGRGGEVPWGPGGAVGILHFLFFRGEFVNGLTTY